MSVLVRQRKNKTGWYVIACYKKQRKTFRFNERPAAEEFAHTLSVKVALGEYGLLKKPTPIVPLPRIPEKDIPSTMPVCVYFIQLEKDGPIKIGYTSNLKTRLAAYRTGSYQDVRLLAAIPHWAAAEEHALHLLFAKDRISREWFHPTENLQFLIRALYTIYSVGTYKKQVRPMRHVLNEEEPEVILDTSHSVLSL